MDKEDQQYDPLHVLENSDVAYSRMARLDNKFKNVGYTNIKNDDEREWMYQYIKQEYSIELIEEIHAMLSLITKEKYPELFKII